ncbi:MAG: hypothetical protein IKV78_01705 [Methanocorpusculum sp.]|nr:hypothetical protein [Methanocorpusculum sp.]
MTEYKCKCGFKIDIPEKMCHRKRLVSIVEAEIRAFCAFCIDDDALVIFGDEGAKLVTACDFIRADLSWDDFQEREEE